MRKIVIVLITCAVMFGGTTVQAQSIELLDALKIAEERLKQGEHDHAFDSLKAVLSAASAAPLNVALGELVQELLENRQSGGAVVAAQAIDDQETRNRILFDILQRQCYATTYKPSEFDLMIGKAEQTALLLTGEFRDQGQVILASHYARVNEFDRALEIVKRIKNGDIRDKGYEVLATTYVRVRKFDRALETVKQVANTERRDHILTAYDPYSGRNNLIPALSRTQEPKTEEDEKMILEMVALVQTPFLKAMALLELCDFYDGRSGFWSMYTKMSVADSQQKRLALLREAVEILLPLPHDVTRCELLLNIYIRHLSSAQHTEADRLLNIVLESIAGIEDKSNQFFFYFLFFRNRDIHLRQPDWWLPADTWEKMLSLAEDTDDPKTKAGRFDRLMTLGTRYCSSGRRYSDLDFESWLEKRTEIANKAHEAFANIENMRRWSELLLNNLPAHNARSEEARMEALVWLDEVAQFMLTHAKETEKWHDDGRRFWEKAIEEYVVRGQIDKMLNFVHSPRIPPDLRQPLYYFAAVELFKTQQFESHVADYQKLYDMLDATEGSPISNAKIQVIYQNLVGRPLHFFPLDNQGRLLDNRQFRLRRISLVPIDWEELFEGALASRGDSQFISACQCLARVISEVKRSNDIVLDIEPLLVLVDKEIEATKNSSRLRALERLRNALVR